MIFGTSFKSVAVKMTEKCMVGHKREARKAVCITDTSWKATDKRKHIKQQKSQAARLNDKLENLEQDSTAKDKEVERRRAIVL